VRHVAAASADRLRRYGPAHSASPPDLLARRKRTAANCAPCVVAKGPGLSPRTQFLPRIQALFVAGWGGGVK
jgi:hypothetical protein